MTRLIFWAGGVVALAAVAATAHGGYAVAVACLVPPGLAWLYPFITDGLALVAYGATSRLSRGGRGYAWTIVVTAAALSGLAQAVFLASGSNLGSSPGHLTVAAELAFGVGAWPAIAVALVAHLLYLLHGAEHPPAAGEPVPVTCDEAWAELEQLDERGLNRSWETAPLTAVDHPTAPDRPTAEPRPVTVDRPTSTDNEAIISDLIEDVRCGKKLPSKAYLISTGMGSPRATRLLNAAADRIGRPLKELQETKP